MPAKRVLVQRGSRLQQRPAARRVLVPFGGSSSSGVMERQSPTVRWAPTHYHTRRRTDTYPGRCRTAFRLDRRQSRTRSASLRPQRSACAAAGSGGGAGPASARQGPVQTTTLPHRPTNIWRGCPPLQSSAWSISWRTKSPSNRDWPAMTIRFPAIPRDVPLPRAAGDSHPLTRITARSGVARRMLRPKLFGRMIISQASPPLLARGLCPSPSCRAFRFAAPS